MPPCASRPPRDPAPIPADRATTEWIRRDTHTRRDSTRHDWQPRERPPSGIPNTPVETVPMWDGRTRTPPSVHRAALLAAILVTRHFDRARCATRKRSSPHRRRHRRREVTRHPRQRKTAEGCGLDPPRASRRRSHTRQRRVRLRQSAHWRCPFQQRDPGLDLRGALPRRRPLPFANAAFDPEQERRSSGRSAELPHQTSPRPHVAACPGALESWPNAPRGQPSCVPLPWPGVATSPS